MLNVYNDDTSYPIEAGDDAGPRVIEDRDSRLGTFTFLLAFSVIWNGVTIWIAWTMLSRFRGNLPDLFSLLFTVPFIVIGIGLVVASIYTFLGLFNPKPILVCSHQYIYPGDEVELSWMFKGSTDRIQRLQVALEGTEEINYLQGTTNKTEKHLFFRQSVQDTQSPEEIAQGAVLFAFPAGIMHSFQTPGGSFRYRIRFQGQIALWPDIDHSFEINLLPPQLSTHAIESD